MTNLKVPSIDVKLLSSIAEQDRLSADKEILALAKKNGNYLLEPSDLEGEEYDWGRYSALVKDYIKFRSAMKTSLADNADQLLRLSKFYQDGSKKIKQSQSQPEAHDPIFDMVGVNIGFSNRGMALGFTTINWQNPEDSLLASGYTASILYEGDFTSHHAGVLDLGFTLGGEVVPALILSGSILIRAGVANQLIPKPDFSECTTQDKFQDAAQVIEDYATREGYRKFKKEFETILEDRSRVNIPGVGNVEIGPRIDLPPTPVGPDMDDVQRVIEEAAEEVATCAAEKAQQVINDSYQTILATGLEANLIFSFGERLGIGAKTALFQDLLNKDKLQAWENRDQFPLDYQISFQLYIFN